MLAHLFEIALQILGDQIFAFRFILAVDNVHVQTSFVALEQDADTLRFFDALLDFSEKRTANGRRNEERIEWKANEV